MLLKLLESASERRGGGGPTTASTHRAVLLVAASSVICAVYWVIRQRQARRSIKGSGRGAANGLSPLVRARLRWQLEHGILEHVENTTLFASQVAGHKEEVLRQIGSNLVLKPLYVPEKKLREVGFYEDLMSTDPAEDWENPSRFVPVYYGIAPVRVNGRLIEFLVMENLCRGFNKVCVLDIKLGRRTYALTASDTKRQYERDKYPYQQEVGFRISGMKVYDAAAQTYWRAGKKFGQSLTPDRVVDGLAVFFCDGKRVREEVVSAALWQLYQLKAWAERQTRYMFVASSVLIIYDGEPDSLGMSHEDVVRVKLIDFAQTTRTPDPEKNLLFGVKRLIEHLHLLLRAIHTRHPLPVFEQVEHLEQSYQ